MNAITSMKSGLHPHKKDWIAVSFDPAVLFVKAFFFSFRSQHATRRGDPKCCGVPGRAIT